LVEKWQGRKGQKLFFIFITFELSHIIKYAAAAAGKPMIPALPLRLSSTSSFEALP
jgi:hypothetical protein